MVLCDPFAINVITQSIIKVLLHLATTESLPRVSLLTVHKGFFTSNTGKLRS